MVKDDYILVVDDDAETRALLREYLSRQGYRVTAVADGNAMDKALEETGVIFDMVVLDLMLPGEDGITLCRRLRKRDNLPVIMLTARGEQVDRITGLETGADDYLPKPFNPRELLARIKSVLHRARTLPEVPHRSDVRYFCFGGWRLNTAAHHLIAPGGVVVPLSGAEFRLLCIFLQLPNVVLSRERLGEMLHSREADLPFNRCVDVQVSRLRRRLQDHERKSAAIRTVRGKGYLFTLPVEIER